MESYAEAEGACTIVDAFLLLFTSELTKRLQLIEKSERERCHMYRWFLSVINHIASHFARFGVTGRWLTAFRDESTAVCFCSFYQLHDRILFFVYWSHAYHGMQYFFFGKILKFGWNNENRKQLFYFIINYRRTWKNIRERYFSLPKYNFWHTWELTYGFLDLFTANKNFSMTGDRNYIASTCYLPFSTYAILRHTKVTR